METKEIDSTDIEICWALVFGFFTFPLFYMLLGIPSDSPPLAARVFISILAAGCFGLMGGIIVSIILDKKGVEIVMDGSLEDQVKFDLKKWWLSLALFGPFILAGILLAFMGVIVIGVKVISYVQAELGVTIIIEGGKISLASLSVYSGIPLLVSVFAAIIASNIYERKNRKASS